MIFAELTEEEKKLAETNDESEICQSLENVNCNNETPMEPATTESTEPKTTDEPIVPTTETSHAMD